MSIDNALHIEARADGSLLVKPAHYNPDVAYPRVLGITGLASDNAHETRLLELFKDLAANYGFVCLGIPSAQSHKEPGKVVIDFNLERSVRELHRGLAELETYAPSGSSSMPVESDYGPDFADRTNPGIAIIGSSAASVVIYEALKGSLPEAPRSVVVINPYLGGSHATPRVCDGWKMLLQRGNDLELTTPQDAKDGRKRVLLNAGGRQLFDYDVVDAVRHGNYSSPTLVVEGTADLLRTVDATRRLEEALRERGSVKTITFDAPHEIDSKLYVADLIAHVVHHALHEHRSYKPHPYPASQPQ